MKNRVNGVKRVKIKQSFTCYVCIALISTFFTSLTEESYRYKLLKITGVFSIYDRNF